MHTDAIVIGLGSNMSGAFGSPTSMLERALQVLPGVGVEVVARSSIWRSRAWPDPADADYFNAVALAATCLTPEALLEKLHDVERAFGRVRSGPNAPRPLDLDLIAYGRLVQAGPPALPHPRALDRRFVMGPLAEIAPGWIPPGGRETAFELARCASVGADAKPV